MSEIIRCTRIPAAVLAAALSATALAGCGNGGVEQASRKHSAEVGTSAHGQAQPSSKSTESTHTGDPNNDEGKESLRPLLLRYDQKYAQWCEYVAENGKEITNSKKAFTTNSDKKEFVMQAAKPANVSQMIYEATFEKGKEPNVANCTSFSSYRYFGSVKFLDYVLSDVLPSVSVRQAIEGKFQEFSIAKDPNAPDTDPYPEYEVSMHGTGHAPRIESEHFVFGGEHLTASQDIVHKLGRVIADDDFAYAYNH